MAPLPAPFLLSSFCSSGWEGGAHSPPGGVSLGFLILLPLPWSSGWSSGWSKADQAADQCHPMKWLILLFVKSRSPSFSLRRLLQDTRIAHQYFRLYLGHFLKSFENPTLPDKSGKIIATSCLQILNKKVLSIAQSSHQRFSFERDSYGSSSVRFASLKSA